ncbi:hypothetical protein VN97_g1867 [Penicillium thymicola]|uniref:Uncharacterized protein n=1 Tax=Penicillium thymicola TaxID=293382 RepID=A0AAI9TQ84_PENTH|nr:hypothetical protein VN97_g1867 [Penicillium thymicola]
MTSLSCNTNACSDNSTAPEINEWIMRDYRHLQNSLSYNHPMHPQFAYLGSSFTMPSTSTYLDIIATVKIPQPIPGSRKSTLPRLRPWIVSALDTIRLVLIYRHAIPLPKIHPNQKLLVADMLREK